MSINNGVLKTTNNKFNEDHKSDVDYALQYTRFFLRCIGIWPRVSTNATRREKIFSKFLLPFCSIIMFVVILPVYLHLGLHDVNMDEFFFLLAPVCHTSSNIIEHLILVFHSDLIKYCVQQITNDWRQIKSKNDRDIAMRNLMVGRRLSFMCALGVYSSGVFYVILQPLCTKSTINEFNETVRPLLYPGNDIIIDLQNGYNYEIVFCNNCISAFFHYTVVNTIFNLASIFVTHACGQIQIIMSDLKSLVENKDVITIQKRIAFITSRHVSILKFSSTIEKLLREICFIEVLAATVIACMLEFYCLRGGPAIRSKRKNEVFYSHITHSCDMPMGHYSQSLIAIHDTMMYDEWKNGNKLAVITWGILLVSIIFNVFIYCYVGELLKEKCEEIGQVAYMIDWYKLPEKTGLALVMIMITSKYPRTLTAGQITELSMATLCSILKSSFAYMGILQAVIG